MAIYTSQIILELVLRALFSVFPAIFPGHMEKNTPLYLVQYCRDGATLKLHKVIKVH